MKYKRWKWHRKSMRLQGYHYGQKGSYFVTFVCHQRKKLFGEIIDGVMQLNSYGQIAWNEWEKTPQIRPNLDVKEFVIMPDHVHVIITILKDVTGWDPWFNHIRGTRPPSKFSRQSFLSPSQTLGAIVRGYMATVTSQINRLRNTPNEKVWQRGYHERIIRTKWAYNNIARYIRENPRRYRG